MALDTVDRGMLQRMIDDAIEDIDAWIQFSRRPEQKSRLQLKEEGDFVLGLTWGRVLGTFTANFAISHRRRLNSEEQHDLYDAVNKRTGEIRKAIFKSG
ncbi:MAG: hypothetical protein ACE5J2_05070 [Nitrososphaerales archaeon]